MTPQGFEVYGRSRMSKNAGQVVQIVRDRVDDVPVLGDFITALLAEKNEGDNRYIEKILKFIERHYKMDNFLWSTCTANIARFVLIKVGRVLCQ